MTPADLARIDRETGEILESAPGVMTNLFGTPDADEIAGEAGKRAVVLKKVVDEKHLFSMIGGKQHLTVDAWTFLGAMFGIFPVLEWTRPLHDATGNRYGWEARVEARNLEGQVVGAAEAMCTKDERRWSSADEYAIRSMAQTRATSKALRMPLSFVVVLAGYESTPSEEREPDVGEPTVEPMSSPLPRSTPPSQAGISSAMAGAAEPASPAPSATVDVRSAAPSAVADQASEAGGTSGGAPAPDESDETERDSPGTAAPEGSDDSYGEGGTTSPSGAAPHTKEQELRLRGLGISLNTALKELREIGIGHSKASQITYDELEEYIRNARGGR